MDAICGVRFSLICLALLFGGGAAVSGCDSALPPSSASPQQSQPAAPIRPDLAAASGWQLVDSHPFSGIWGSGPSDIWAVGDTTYHFDGTAWTEFDKHPGYRVWGSSPTDVYSVGLSYGTSSQPIYHFDGSRFTPVFDPMAEIDAIWGSGPRDVYATGISIILHFDGTTWSRDSYQPGFRLSALWGSGSGDVYVFGGAAVGPGVSNRYSHFDGKTWTGISVGASPLARNDAMWGSGPNDIWTVGDGLLHWDGTSWSLEPGYNGPLRFYGVWGTGPRDVWAVREDSTVLHYDGSSWSSARFPFPSGLRDVWGPAPVGIAGGASEVYVVGYQGIYRWQR